VNPLAALARFTQPADEPAARCQLCDAGVDDPGHAHVVDLRQGTLLCTCGRCARLYDGDRYRVVPTRVLFDPAFRLTDAEWAALGIPVALAFALFNSRLDRWVALYPSPAGATEAEVDPEAFAALVARAPLLRALAPDVEALLIHRPRGKGDLCLGVPIDACYRLVGIVRRDWRGFHGGDEVWRRIEAFFGELRAGAIALPGATA
jgi:hypothetical protein